MKIITYTIMQVTVIELDSIPPSAPEIVDTSASELRTDLRLRKAPSCPIRELLLRRVA
jgi:hypothetical protein